MVATLTRRQDWTYWPRLDLRPFGTLTSLQTENSLIAAVPCKRGDDQHTEGTDRTPATGDFLICLQWEGARFWTDFATAGCW
jgi:hypothetical protein